VFDLIAFGLAVAAEQRRTTVSFSLFNSSNISCQIYLIISVFISQFHIFGSICLGFLKLGS
jgi:hypothetical protein